MVTPSEYLENLIDSWAIKICKYQFSKKDISALAGIHPETLNKIFTRKNKHPKITHLDGIERAFQELEKGVEKC